MTVLLGLGDHDEIYFTRTLHLYASNEKEWKLQNKKLTIEC
jgi:hypothetical protein